jgi:large subunit ribosomal protein L25
MPSLSLHVEIRDKKIPAKQLRDEGFVPAVLYGHKTKNLVLSAPYKEVDKLYREAGENTLIDLKVHDKAPVKVLIHDVEHDVLSNRITHVDFYQVRMDEKINADIPLHFVNEPPAVKELGGVLVKQLDYLPVKCLPNDLLKDITIDLSVLKDFEIAIRVEDLLLPDSIEILKSKDQVIVLVTPPRVEEVETPQEEEVIEGEKAEGTSEEGAEVKTQAAEAESMGDKQDKS